MQILVSFLNNQNIFTHSGAIKIFLALQKSTPLVLSKKLIRIIEDISLEANVIIWLERRMVKNNYTLLFRCGKILPN